MVIWLLQATCYGSVLRQAWKQGCIFNFCFNWGTTMLFRHFICFYGAWCSCYSYSIFSDTTRIIFTALFVNLCHICRTFLCQLSTSDKFSLNYLTAHLKSLLFLYPMKSLENCWCTRVLTFLGVWKETD